MFIQKSRHILCLVCFDVRDLFYFMFAQEFVWGSDLRDILCSDNAFCICLKGEEIKFQNELQSTQQDKKHKQTFVQKIVTFFL